MSLNVAYLDLDLEKYLRYTFISIYLMYFLGLRQPALCDRSIPFNAVLLLIVFSVVYILFAFDAVVMFYNGILNAD